MQSFPFADRVLAIDPALPGVATMLLHKDEHEHVTMEHWDAGAHVEYAAPDGLELLVVQGSFSDGSEEFRRLSWLRLPRGSGLSAVAGSEGTRVWMKRGHLASDIIGPKKGITDQSLT